MTRLYLANAVPTTTLLTHFLDAVLQLFGYRLMLTQEQQEAFVGEALEIYLPIPGGWGKMGHTHIRLAAAMRMY